MVSSSVRGRKGTRNRTQMYIWSRIFEMVERDSRIQTGILPDRTEEPESTLCPSMSLLLGFLSRLVVEPLVEACNFGNSFALQKTGPLAHRRRQMKDISIRYSGLWKPCFDNINGPGFNNAFC